MAHEPVEGRTSSKSDDFALAKARLARARLFARKAAIGLGLVRYP